MSPVHTKLLVRLRTLLAQLFAGTAKERADAKDVALRLKAAAKAGNDQAKLAYNTLAALYWNHNTPTWKRAEAYYTRLLTDEPKAWSHLRVIVKKAEAKDEFALKAMAMLKAVHNQQKKSVWYPGAPTTGSYPMPHRDRPGIAFGADVMPDPSRYPGGLQITPDVLSALLGAISMARLSVPAMPDPGEFMVANPAYIDTSRSDMAARARAVMDAQRARAVMARLQGKMAAPKVIKRAKAFVAPALQTSVNQLQSTKSSTMSSLLPSSPFAKTAFRP
jgi:hypothetical protein